MPECNWHSSAVCCQASYQARQREHNARLAEVQQALESSGGAVLQADDQEFMDWEQRTAIKRSEGTFFQNLYRIKKELPGSNEDAAVETEVRSTWAYVFIYRIVVHTMCK